MALPRTPHSTKDLLAQGWGQRETALSTALQPDSKQEPKVAGMGCTGPTLEMNWWLSWGQFVATLQSPQPRQLAWPLHLSLCLHKSLP